MSTAGTRPGWCRSTLETHRCDGSDDARDTRPNSAPECRFHHAWPTAPYRNETRLTPVAALAIMAADEEEIPIPPDAGRAVRRRGRARRRSNSAPHGTDL